MLADGPVMPEKQKHRLSYAWPEPNVPIPGDEVTLSEYRRRFGANYTHAPPIDPFRCQLKPDVDLHRMSDVQKLESIKRDLTLDGMDVRNALMTEALNTHATRRRKRPGLGLASASTTGGWDGNPCVGRQQVLDGLRLMVDDALGRAGQLHINTNVLNAVVASAVASDGKRWKEHVWTLPCLMAMQTVWLDGTNDPSKYASGAPAGAFVEVHRPAAVDTRKLRLPAQMAHVLGQLEHVDAGEAEETVRRGPLACLITLLREGGVVTQIAALALIANLSKISELAGILVVASVDDIVPLINVMQPELLQLVAVVAVHVFSTWPFARSKIARLNGVHRLGRTLTTLHGAVCAMVHERATLSLVQLCVEEPSRTRAFKINIIELMLHQLQHGQSAAAVVGASQVICLLCLCNERDVVRVCLAPVDAMLHASSRMQVLCALRCIMYLAHTEDEKAHFARTGMVDRLCQLLASSNFSLLPHILRALLCLALRRNVANMIRAAGGVTALEACLNQRDPVVQDLAAQLLLKLDEFQALEQTKAPVILEEYAPLVASRRQTLKRRLKSMLSKWERDFTRDELDEVRDKFKRFDVDRSGTINKDELRECLLHCGFKVTRKKCRRIMTELDVDRSGEIEWEEFVRVMHDLKFNSSFTKMLTNGLSSMVKSALV